MRILYLTPYLPYPPTQGAAMRNWQILRHAAKSHEVYLLSFARSRAEARAASELRAVCREVRMLPAPEHGAMRRLRTLLGDGLPDMAVRLWSPAFAAELEALRRRPGFDFIQAEAIEMAPYLQGLREATVFDEHNAEWLLQWRAYRSDLAQGRLPLALYSAIQFRRLARFERAALLGADRRVAVSQADRRALCRLSPGLEVEVIPNGVDTASYTPSAAAPEEPELVFTGAMNFRPNVDGAVWFCREVLPLVRRQVPAARLTIVGRQPSAAVRRLSTAMGVRVTGEVPDIRPWLAGAQVCVVPLRMGSGTRLKLMEAMAMERPVVSTPLGAEGVPAGEESGVLLAASAEAFAAAVVSLLRDAPLRLSLGRAARVMACARFDWERLMPAFDRVYEGLERRVPSSGFRVPDPHTPTPPQLSPKGVRPEDYSHTPTLPHRERG